MEWYANGDFSDDAIHHIMFIIMHWRPYHLLYMSQVKKFVSGQYWLNWEISKWKEYNNNIFRSIAGFTKNRTVGINYYYRIHFEISPFFYSRLFKFIAYHIHSDVLLFVKIFSLCIHFICNTHTHVCCTRILFSLTRCRFAVFSYFFCCENFYS